MMMSSTHRVLLAAALLAGSLSGVSLAEETSIWTGKADGGFVTLTYGPLNPDKSPLLMLSCFNGMGIAVLNVHTDLPNNKPGTPLAIELVSGDLTVPVAAEATRDQTSDTIFGEASDIEVKPILEVLRGDGPVTVKVDGTSTALSDHGRAEAVGQFTENCELS